MQQLSAEEFIEKYKIRSRINDAYKTYYPIVMKRLKEREHIYQSAMLVDVDVDPAMEKLRQIFGPEGWEKIKDVVAMLPDLFKGFLESIPTLEFLANIIESMTLSYAKKGLQKLITFIGSTSFQQMANGLSSKVLAYLTMKAVGRAMITQMATRLAMIIASLMLKFVTLIDLLSTMLGIVGLIYDLLDPRGFHHEIKKSALDSLSMQTFTITMLAFTGRDLKLDEDDNIARVSKKRWHRIRRDANRNNTTLDSDDSDDADDDEEDEEDPFPYGLPFPTTIDPLMYQPDIYENEGGELEIAVKTAEYLNALVVNSEGDLIDWTAAETEIDPPDIPSTGKELSELLSLNTSALDDYGRVGRRESRDWLIASCLFGASLIGLSLYSWHQARQIEKSIVVRTIKNARVRAIT
jgi:hypothetical protein